MHAVPGCTGTRNTENSAHCTHALGTAGHSRARGHPDSTQRMGRRTPRGAGQSAVHHKVRLRPSAGCTKPEVLEGCWRHRSSRNECPGERSGRPFREQVEGLAGGLPSIQSNTHTEKDYCQLVYFHNVIFVFRKLELSLEEKMGENRALSTWAAWTHTHILGGGRGRQLLGSICPGASFPASLMPSSSLPPRPAKAPPSCLP